MQVLVMASQKGGVGKTTLALHLAVAFEAAGVGPVVLCDTDDQGTLTRWWNERVAETPKMAAMAITDLEAALPQLADQGFSLAIVDTAGRANEANRQVLRHADFVLVPVKPSAADVWALGKTVEDCQKLGRSFAFVLSQATRGAAITVQALATLSELGVAAPVVIHNRVPYANAIGLGQTAQEMEPRSLAANEIDSLRAFLQSKLSAFREPAKKTNRQTSKRMEVTAHG